MVRLSIGSLTALVALGAAAPLALGATPSPAQAPAAAAAGADLGHLSLPNGSVRARFGLRVLGMKIGEPEVHLGPVETAKSGATIRTLRFKAGTWGKLRRLYPFDTTSVSIIDGTTYRPMRTVIKMLRGSDRKTIDLRFKGPRVVGSVTRNGEVEVVDELHAAGMMDTISSAIWMAARDFEPGETDQVPHHSGTTRYRLWFEAGEIEEVRVPAGTFEALKIVCTLYRWEHGAPAPKTQPTTEPTTQWTVWMGRDTFRTPVKVLADVPILGEIAVELEARRQE